MDDVIDLVRERASEILREWERLVDTEPWRGLPTRERVDHIPPVIAELLDATLHVPPDPDRRRRAITAASEHGQARRLQALPDHVLFREYEFVREAIWHYLRENVQPSDASLELIFRIDRAIGDLTRAALRGYHRPELEEQGRWPEDVDALINEAPPGHRTTPDTEWRRS